MNRLNLWLALAATSLLGGCEGDLDLEYPWMLAVGGVACLAAIVQTVRKRRNRTAMAYSRGEATTVLGWTPRVMFSRLPAVLRILALVAVAVACSRPQLEEFDQRAVEDIDIFLVLDMSGSMAAVDMHSGEIAEYQQRLRREPPNRFDNAISTLKSFVAGRSRDRIGMVVFAREAYLQFPLTLDYSTVQTLLDRLELNAIDASATAIGNSLGLAIRGLLNSQARSRAVILITDGKQQGGNISPMHAAETAAEEGIQLYTILVGREGPAMAPTNRRSQFGVRYAQQDYPVDPALLQRIAETTGGSFYRAAEPEELETGLNAILDELETTQMQDVSSVLEIELYGWFAAVALALLLLEGLLAWLLARRFP